MTLGGRWTGTILTGLTVAFAVTALLALQPRPRPGASPASPPNASDTATRASPAEVLGKWQESHRRWRRTAPDPAEFVAYVSTQDPAAVVAIDVEARVTIATVSAPARTPRDWIADIAVTPDGGRVYLAAPVLGRVFVIDAATHTLLGSPEPVGVWVGGKPNYLLIAPGGTRAYVRAGEALSVIDTDPSSPRFHQVSTLSDGRMHLGGQRPTGIACLPDGSRLYMADMLADSVSVIDLDPRSPLPHTVLPVPDGATIRVGRAPLGLAIHPAGTRLYVANFVSDDLSVVDTDPSSHSFHRVVATIRMDDGPEGVVVAPDGSRVYVAHANAGSVLVADTESGVVVSSLAVGLSPRRLAMTPDGSRCLVTNRDSGDVSVIDTDPTSPTLHTVLASIPVAGRPYGLAIARNPRRDRPRP